MEELGLREADRQQLRRLGIAIDQVRRQIAHFVKPCAYMRLNRPCSLEDGIVLTRHREREKYLQLHARAAAAGRFCKFVPASGAATRMFQVLHQVFDSSGDSLEDIRQTAASGDATAEAFLRLLTAIRSLPFYTDLKEVMARDGLSPETVLEQGGVNLLLQYLLTERGLNYASLPKGLLKFHCYPNGCRTSFEEHLCEAAHDLCAPGGTCRVHFTISPEYEQKFNQLVQEVRPRYEKQFGVHYEIEFSFQSPSTDTLAVDADNQPFRDPQGDLLFRPGGHGALLPNLSELQADLVFIKNIDNVAPDHRKEPVLYWHKILGGYLVHLQQEVHHWLRVLRAPVPEEQLKEVEEFCRGRLFITLPDTYPSWPVRDKQAFLSSKLRRPLRVCGMVPNTGEPGGGPFWVEGPDGTLSLQIVEKAQVDFSDPGQEAIWQAATHFNPVNLVCAMRDEEGNPFDLHQYVDEDACFISEKSKDGRVLKALELPGLWNGAMADWITVFVEVPGSTFNPVKTVADLLRPEHQPEA